MLGYKMEKRYQVFISSTFNDLKGARQEVSHALLQTDCFPAGMELFPAADEEQFEYIKTIIDESDYYIVISAGMYGSIHPEAQTSYTEMEYDYAVEINKPIIRLLHKNPLDTLRGDEIEKDETKREKLLAFREKMETKRLVKYWEEPKELGQQVILALLDIKKRRPAIGWVRGDGALTIETIKELEALRKKANSTDRKNQTTTIGFDELTGNNVVDILASNGSNDVNIDKERVDNTKIASAVLCALLAGNKAKFISERTGYLLSLDFIFPETAKNFKDYWVQIDYRITEHFLHYLESRKLVSSHFLGVVYEYKLTELGKQNATRISSSRIVK